MSTYGSFLERRFEVVAKAGSPSIKKQRFNTSSGVRKQRRPRFTFAISAVAIIIHLLNT